MSESIAEICARQLTTFNKESAAWVHGEKPRPFADFQRVGAFKEYVTFEDYLNG